MRYPGPKSILFSTAPAPIDLESEKFPLPSLPIRAVIAAFVLISPNPSRHVPKGAGVPFGRGR